MAAQLLSAPLADMYSCVILCGIVRKTTFYYTIEWASKQCLCNRLEIIIPLRATWVEHPRFTQNTPKRVKREFLTKLVKQSGN